MNRIVAGVLAILFALGLATFWRHSRMSRTAPVASAEQLAVSATIPVAMRDEAQRTFPLNAPNATIQDDVRLLEETFTQWQTNFAATGNPVGTNAEITAALTGKNSLSLDLIPRGHPAINSRGELCDRWGTPFRFHQKSGREMEIISAGPDRDFATADDVKMP